MGRPAIYSPVVTSVTEMADDPGASGRLLFVLALFAGLLLRLVQLGSPDLFGPDGPTIQAAMVRALASGATVAASLDLAAELRRRVDVPIVLFSYANPLLRFGAEALALRASQAGISGLLLVDLPPEHCAPLRAPAAAHGLDWIGLVAPTTTPQRRAAVLANASGFIYAVSLTGVTGTALDPNDPRLHQHLAELRAGGPLPVVVGFGVRSPDDVRALARSADGVVVGSALVEAGQRGTGALGALVRDLRAATLRQA